MLLFHNTVQLGTELEKNIRSCNEIKYSLYIRNYKRLMTGENRVYLNQFKLGMLSPAFLSTFYRPHFNQQQQKKSIS